MSMFSFYKDAKNFKRNSFKEKMDYSERLIINGLKTGDTEAYRYIYDTHYQVLCFTANRYVHDQFVAETIVGDLIFKLWEKRDSLDINTSLRSYLSQSVRHASMDYLRSKRQRYEIASSRLADDGAVPEPSSDADNDPLSEVINSELEERVDEAIAALPAECRRVFEMSRFFLRVSIVISILPRTVVLAFGFCHTSQEQLKGFLAIINNQRVDIG